MYESKINVHKLITDKAKYMTSCTLIQFTFFV